MFAIMKYFVTVAISAVLMMNSCVGVHRQFEVYPFGVKLGMSAEEFLQVVDNEDNVVGWEDSETYRMRCDKRDGVSDELLDRVPEFGSLFYDRCMGDSLKFVTRVSHNIPLSTMVYAFCSATLEQGRILSFCCIQYFDDFDDVSSAVRKYVNMFDTKYGHYDPLPAILDAAGNEYTSLNLFKEGAFLWKNRGHRVEMFINKYQILHDIAFRDLDPMQRYELVVRYL